MKKMINYLSLLLVALIPSSALAGDSYTVPVINATVKDLGEVLKKIVDFLFSITALLAVLFIIIGGFLLVTSAGNTERVKQAKQTLTYATVGLVVVILSYVIVTLVIKGANYLF